MSCDRWGGAGADALATDQICGRWAEEQAPVGP